MSWCWQLSLAQIKGRFIWRLFWKKKNKQKHTKKKQGTNYFLERHIFPPEWLQHYCVNSSSGWVGMPWLTGCCSVSCSKEEASAIETELLRDYRFGQQQLIEIWGQACAVAITKVCVFHCSVCLCSLCLFLFLPRHSSPTLWSNCSPFTQRWNCRVGSVCRFKSVTDNIAHSVLFTAFRKNVFTVKWAWNIAPMCCFAFRALFSHD